MWHSRVLQKRTGGFTLCATSDEGGGFVEGCEHVHQTAQEAAACLEAKVRVGYGTGFPEAGIGLARIAYDAYVAQAGGKSLATGQPLPDWTDLSMAIQAAWLAAARAVQADVLASMRVHVEALLRP